jgi:hypothetical protein
MELLPLEHEISRRYEFDVASFEEGRYVYVTVKANHYETKTLRCDAPGGKDFSSKEDPEYWRKPIRKATFGIALPGDYFREMCTLHGKNPSWLLEVWEGNTPGKRKLSPELQALSPEQMDFYKRDESTYPHHTDLPTLDVKEALEKGLFHLVVRTGPKEGIWYDVDGKPVPRNFHFDDISARICASEYSVDKASGYLKGHPQTRDVEVEHVPSYNQESMGKKAISFTFVPDAEQFEKLIEADSFHRRELVYEWLNIQQFKREK